MIKKFESLKFLLYQNLALFFFSFYSFQHFSVSYVFLITVLINTTTTAAAAAITRTKTNFTGLYERTNCILFILLIIALTDCIHIYIRVQIEFSLQKCFIFYNKCIIIRFFFLIYFQNECFCFCYCILYVTILIYCIFQLWL